MKKHLTPGRYRDRHVGPTKKNGVKEIEILKENIFFVFYANMLYFRYQRMFHRSVKLRGRCILCEHCRQLRMPVRSRSRRKRKILQRYVN